MKQVTRQLIALILALCALASAAMPAWAASVDTPPEEPLAPEYVGISTLIYNCTVSSGTATCTTSVHLKNGYTAYTSMRLQKSVDKSTTKAALHRKTAVKNSVLKLCMIEIK